MYNIGESHAIKIQTIKCRSAPRRDQSKNPFTHANIHENGYNGILYLHCT